MAKRITGIKAYPIQNFTMSHPGGVGLIRFRVFFKPRLSAWFIDIESDRLNVNGFRLTTSKNILSQYRRNAGFGLAVLSAEGVDPILLNDFESGRVEMYLLTEEETREIAEAIEND